MNIKAFIQRHPVASYFGLAYMIPWVGILIGAGPKFIRGEAPGLMEGMFMLLVMLAGPSLAGIAMTRIVDGESGLRDLFSRMGLWRVGARWYVAALIFPVLILAVLLTLTTLISPVFAPSLTAVGIVFGLLAGFFEEIGWMGYAFPKMQLKNSPLAAGILLGLLWGLWHLAAHYFGAYRDLGVHWLPNFVYLWIVGMTATRVLIVWVYCNTGSVLLTQLMHASSTGFLYILSPAPISPADTNLWYAVYAVVLWVAVAIVAARYGKRLVLASSGKR